MPIALEGRAVTFHMLVGEIGARREDRLLIEFSNRCGSVEECRGFVWRDGDLSASEIVACK